MKHPHQISQLILELDIPDIDNVQNLQNEAASFVRNEVQQVLNVLLDQYDISGKLVRIEKLELDLSDLDFKSVDKQFLKSSLHERLEKQLSEQILIALNGDNTEMNTNVQITALSDSSAQLIMLYLQNGRLPWWGAHHQDFKLNQEVQGLYENDKEKLINGLSAIISNQNVQKRLVNQASKALLSKLVLDLFKVSDSIKPVFQHLISNLSKPEHWQNTLSSLHSDRDESAKLASLLDQQDNLNLRNLINEGVGDQKTLLLMAIAQMQSIELGEKRRQLYDIVDQNSDLVSKDELEKLLKTDQHSSNIELDVDDFSSSSEKDLIPIFNAGLVILHPYLVPFFTAINLVQNNEFVDDKARHHAAYLLHFIATGELEAPQEHELVLNKLFCGIDIDEPIEAFTTYGDTEMKECEELLSSLIENWPAVKNTSLQGIREMFLKRQGSLRYESGAWAIKIEREAMDILIDKLPWGISMLKAPWNQQMIYVEW